MEENDKDITDQYTGSQVEEGEPAGINSENGESAASLDATQIIDSDQIGHLTALSMSYLICKPKEIEIKGEHFDLQQNYIDSSRGDFAKIARGLNLDSHLEQLNLGELTPLQAISIFGAASGIVVMRQRKEFQKQLEQLKQEAKTSEDQGGDHAAE